MTLIGNWLRLRTPRNGWQLWFISSALSTLLWGCLSPQETSPAGTLPGEVAFVDSQLCADCHQVQHQQWLGSHHDLAMQVASADTVLGDFEGSSFTHFGVTTRFYEQNGRFYVNTEGPDGKLADFAIKFTCGVDPLQQYLIEFPGGRLQCLTVAWDTRTGRWFHLYPNERIEPDDPLHWTGRYQNWNLMCAECHTTNLEKNYSPETDGYDTVYHEIDVGCQACHGPGERHVQWALEHQSGESSPDADYGLVVDFAGNSSRYEVEACAPCHSRRSRITHTWRHTGPLEDHFRVATLSEGLYYPDGQILDEVYVYGSFLQSKMFDKGVRCTDCHDPHTLQPRLDGDALCTRCHQAGLIEDFPTLKPGDYESPEHHFHPVDSEAARCVSCHMPERTYMVVDPRRDHSFRVPRPDLSLKLGTPNACNGCHSNRSSQWAQSRVVDWYGPARAAQPHYGEVIAAGRSGEPAAGEALSKLTGDLQQPAIVRATGLELLRRYGRQGLEAVIASTRDQDAMVRVAAVAALDRLEPDQRLEMVAPLLEDPARRVRLEAARVLASVPAESMRPDQQRKLRAALEEFEIAQLAMADTPWAHLNQGVVYLDQGRPADAERAFRRAIERDAGFTPALVNLATLLNQLGRNEEAEQALRQAVERAGEQGELYYNLGLLLAEMGKLEEAADSLGRAARLMPERARVHYNYGLALQQLGRRAEAEQALRGASRIDPEDGEILYALVVFYMQQQDWNRALESLEKLRRQQGPNPRLAQMEEQIRRMLSDR